MEIARDQPRFALRVGDASQVGEARRGAVALAQACAFDETSCAAIGIVVTELANNLVRHAGSGQVVVQPAPASSGRAIDILSIDCGPGMRNVGQCLQDGYSTGGTPGTGLGAVKRFSNEFDIFSVAGQGTVIVSCVSANPRSPQGKRSLRSSAIAVCAPGETECGDTWRLALGPDAATFMVADGLGHGPLAAEAAAAAAATFERDPACAPGQFLDAAHRDISRTRGAAVAAARIDFASGRLSYAGVGNISGTLVGPDGATKGLFSHNGTVGGQVRKVQTFDYGWPENGLLIMHTDGIQSRWSLASYPGLMGSHPAIVAAVLVRDFTRGRDDVTVLVAKLEAQGPGP